MVTAFAGSGAVLLVAARLHGADSSVERAASLERSAASLRAALLDQETGFRGYELTGDDAFLDPYHAGRSAEQAALSALESAASGDSGLLASVRDVRAAAETWQRAWADRMMQLIAAGKRVEAQTQAESAAGRDLFGAVRTRLEALDARIAGVVGSAHRDLEAAMGFVVTGGTIAVASMLAVLIVLAAYLFAVAARPLMQLASAARDLGLGKRPRFPIGRDDEIGTLAETVSRLDAEVRRRSDDATVASDRAAALAELAETLNLATEERGLLEATAGTLRTIVAVDSGEILLLTTAGDLLLKRVAWGAGGEATDEKAFPSAACPAVRTGRLMQTENGRASGGLSCQVRTAAGGAHACLPIQAMGRLLGVVHLYRENAASPFTPHELQLAAQVATETALVIANRRLVSELEAMAMTDPLTRVRNGRFFDAYLEREAAAAERDGRPLGLIMLDVDHFKEFNDLYGHPAGDEALKTLTRTIESTIRTSDTLARYGGEEFIVAVRNADLDESVAVAEKLRSAIEQTPVRLEDGRRIPLSASFGVACSSLHGYDRRILVLRADQALYRAKQLGRNRVELPFTTADPPPVKSDGHRRAAGSRAR